MAAVAGVVPALADRPVKNTICLFDVDGTLTPARLHASPEMLQLLTKLRHQVAIGFVGGSDLAKQQEQLGTPEIPVTTMFDYCFSENGLTAFRMGVPLASTSFIQWLGEEKYKKLSSWILHYIADLDVPVRRGTFIEFRNGMINVSPIGRNASTKERGEFERWDLERGARKKMVRDLQAAFPDLGLTYSIGGQISFDVFPRGWDKTYCLQHVEADAEVKFGTVHFFGDKIYEGGNDWEIAQDARTVEHAVKNPEETMRILKEMFPQLE